MAFGCAADEQLLNEFKESLNYSPIKIKKSDLKKLIFNLAEKMEKFIREKNLYDEFYERYVMLDLKVDISFSDLFTSEFQRNNPLPDKSYNEYIQEHFNGK